jgi:acyl carrier protein
MDRLVRGHAAQVLRVPADRIPATQPLKALGMDSLMSLELRNRLESDLGVAVSATAIWNYPTVPQLAGHLATLIAATEPDAPASTAPPTGSGSEAEVRTEAASGTVVLDREQIESMLDRELAAIDELLGDGR